MPLHPVFVHFPVALLVVAWVLYVLAFFKIQDKPWYFAAWCTLVAGSVMILPAILSGSQAEDAIPAESIAAEVVSNHEIAAYVVGWLAIMFTGWASWRQKRWHRAEAGLFLGLLFLLVALVTYTAMLGGELVYEHGIGVTSLPSPPS